MNKCCLSAYYECTGEAKEYRIYSGKELNGVAKYCDSCSTDERSRGFNLIEVNPVRELVAL